MKNSSYEPGEYEFQQWMRKYWGGVKLEWYEDASEYSGPAQIAWEAWRKFWPKENPQDVKLWSMFAGARYREGKLIEEYDHGILSSMPPMMVEYSDYAVLHKYAKELEERIVKLLRTRNDG